MTIEKERSSIRETSSIRGTGKCVAYVRVSTIEQNEEQQILAIQKHYPNVDKVFMDKISGPSLDRSGVQNLIDYVREDDIVIVQSISRLSRNCEDLRDTLKLLQKKKVKFVSINDNLNFDSSTAEFILSILTMIVELEVTMNRDRHKQGIQAARVRGAYKGRVEIKKPNNFEVCFEKWANSPKFKNRYSLVNFGEETGLKRSTLIKFVNKHKKELEENYKRIE